jgi:hypothetical protein
MSFSNTYALSNLTGHAFVAGEAVRAIPAPTRVGTQRIVSAAPAYKPIRFAPVRFNRYVKPLLSRYDPLSAGRRFALLRVALAAIVLFCRNS